MSLYRNWLTGLGAGLVLSGLLLLAFGSREPSPEEVEAMARAIGMVRPEEVRAEPAAVEPVTVTRDRAIIVIPPGSSAAEIAGYLRQAGLIDDAEGFLQLARREGVTGRFQSGVFSFEVPAAEEEILKRLVSSEK